MTMTTHRKKTAPDARMQKHVRIGISGWKYEPWRGNFYPEALTQKDELAYASHALPTIEINSTFYGLRTPANFASWYADTPADFVFSVKASQRITHRSGLKGVEAPIARFLASGLFELKEKLGPILWQFPPWLQFDAARFEAFLALLPHDTTDAHAFIAKHLPGDHAEVAEKHRLRHAIEVRHESFVDPSFIALLRKYKAALVVADTGGKWPEFGDVCTDFLYLRLHGAADLYHSNYIGKVIDTWAARIHAWYEGRQPDDMPVISGTAAPARVHRDVFCYFDNTEKVNAPRNALSMLGKLGIPQTNDFEPRPSRGARAAKAANTASTAKTG
ncbi:DUF72 domain-containing protein [Uliginosibacterium sp. H3]|uniref:DUF72 domain-containing protein n=1 Tax=Uliginosibacterium silvisoli TaxID=3114758 RepID=A0ABU6K6M8_9RHOO|nr:DUF72 domain-containing protein [Uliginosibacterium sp. H3]